MGMLGILPGPYREWSHPGLNKVHRGMRQGPATYIRTDSWRLGWGKREQEHRSGTRRGGPKQGPQILHFQPLETVSLTHMHLKLILPLLPPERPHHPPWSHSEIRYHLCLLHVLLSLDLTHGLPVWSSSQSLSHLVPATQYSVPLFFGPNRFPAATDSCVQPVPHRLASTQKPKCAPSKAQSWSSESLGITFRLVSGSPPLLSEPALLSPQDYVLHPSLSTLYLSHNGPHVVSWTSCCFRPLCLRNSAQKRFLLGSPS